MDNTSFVFRVSDLTTTDWKNGGGRTRELAIYPDESGQADFVWRVSIADVEGDGPFSDYAGIDRTIVLLGGAGMVLRSRTSGVLRHTLNRTYVPFVCSGDEEIDAKIIQNPVRDFNLMVRRGIAHGFVEIWRGPMAFAIPDATRLVFVAQGQAMLKRGRAKEMQLIADDAVRLYPEDSFIELTSGSIILAVTVELP